MEVFTSKTSTGPIPLKILLMGMGACASSDVVSILQKMRENVVDVTLEMEAERAYTIPCVFTKIQAVFKVTRRGIPLSNAEEAVKLSA